MSVRSRIGIGIGIGMCAMVSLLGSNVVFAEGHAEKGPGASIWKTLGFQVAGALETSYTQNFNNPNTNLNQLRSFYTQANSFVPNVAQILIERPAKVGSAVDRLGFRARVSFGPNARFSRARTNYQPGTDNNELDLDELYAEYIVPIGKGLKIQAGEIRSLIGYESISSWENPHFSHSFAFAMAQPFSETGIVLTYPFTSWATAAVGLANGWDNIEDNNRGKTFTWNLALTPHEKFWITFYGSYGAEQSNGNAFDGTASTGICTSGTTGCDPRAKRTVVGSIIMIKPTDRDTLIVEPYYGNEGHDSESSRSHNARWNALIAQYMHDFNDQQQPHAFSLHIRGEIFEDAGGARSCIGGINFNGGANTCAGSGGGFLHAEAVNHLIPNLTLWEGTFTLQYKPTPSLITRAEFRYDKADRNVFLRGGEATNNQQTLGFNVVYLF